MKNKSVESFNSTSEEVTIGQLIDDFAKEVTGEIFLWGNDFFLISKDPQEILEIAEKLQQSIYKRICALGISLPEAEVNLETVEEKNARIREESERIAQQEALRADNWIVPLNSAEQAETAYETVQVLVAKDTYVEGIVREKISDLWVVQIGDKVALVAPNSVQIHFAIDPDDLDIDWDNLSEDDDPWEKYYDDLDREESERGNGVLSLQSGEYLFDACRSRETSHSRLHSYAEHTSLDVLFWEVRIDDRYVILVYKVEVDMGGSHDVSRFRSYATTPSVVPFVQQESYKKINNRMTYDFISAWRGIDLHGSPFQLEYFYNEKIVVKRFSQVPDCYNEHNVKFSRVGQGNATPADENTIEVSLESGKMMNLQGYNTKPIAFSDFSIVGVECLGETLGSKVECRYGIFNKRLEKMVIPWGYTHIELCSAENKYGTSIESNLLYARGDGVGDVYRIENNSSLELYSTGEVKDVCVFSFLPSGLYICAALVYEDHVDILNGYRDLELWESIPATGCRLTGNLEYPLLIETPEGFHNRYVTYSGVGNLRLVSEKRVKLE